MTANVIRSARYANADHSAMVVDSEEAGPIALSAADTPEAWAAILASGIPISAYVAPETLATIVTRRQFFLGLYVWNLTDEANAAVEAAGGVTRVAWDTSSSFHIDDPELVAVVTSLGKRDLLQEFFNFCSML